MVCGEFYWNLKVIGASKMERLNLGQEIEKVTQRTEDLAIVLGCIDEKIHGSGQSTSTTFMAYGLTTSRKW